MSRGVTRDSYHHSRSDRARSGSPTEYYRHQQSTTDHLYDRAFELKAFIYGGIEKFLDKQAVRDLINEYDTNDIFIGGEQNFYEQLYEEQLQNERKKIQNFVDKFNKNGNRNPNGPMNTLFNLNKTSPNGATAGTGQNQTGTPKSNGKRSKGGNNTTASNKPTRSNSTASSLVSSFISLVWVKVFNIKTVKSAKRRESEFFDQNFP